ncbi:MAG: DNA (cytosine-5-)-methyltransferase [Opitutales bacterium]|nr:DNA (cytosine-5-)-methyltransferase [Opitutales bacterium]
MQGRRAKIAFPIEIRPSAMHAHPMPENPASTRNGAPDRSRTFAEYFAGIGLMRMGLEAVGWNIAFANDIDPDKKGMYQEHFRDAQDHFALGDIHQLDVQTIPTTDLATASFPCNDLSLAGSRRGLEGKQSSAFWGFVRILREMGDRKPPVILLENVAGFLTSHNGADIHSALTALNDLGYAVDIVIIDAERFVPQSRVRLFVVGARADRLSNYHGAQMVEETASFFECPVRPKAVARFIFEHPDIQWLPRCLPALPRRTRVLKDILEDLPEDSGYWWSAERTEYLAGQMNDRHSAVLQTMKKAREWSYGTVFRRVRNGRSMAEMRTDGIAGCLRTPRGGSGRQILVRAGFGKVNARLLTPRECARLMGANDFRINTTLNKALFGFGDAVCVPVISWIAENYLNPLFREIEATEQSVSTQLSA